MKVIGQVERQPNPTSFGWRFCGAVVGFRSCVAASNLQTKYHPFSGLSSWPPAKNLLEGWQAVILSASEESILQHRRFFTSFRTTTVFRQLERGGLTADVGLRSCVAAPNLQTKYHPFSGLSSWPPAKNLAAETGSSFTGSG